MSGWRSTLIEAKGRGKLMDEWLRVGKWTNGHTNGWMDDQVNGWIDLGYNPYLELIKFCTYMY